MTLPTGETHPHSWETDDDGGVRCTDCGTPKTWPGRGPCWARAWCLLAYEYGRLHGQAAQMSKTIDAMSHEPCPHCGKIP